MRNMIVSNFYRTKESIKDFTLDPINNLGYLIPVAIGLTAFISGVVTYIMFIVNGGYSAQIDAIKEFGLLNEYGYGFTIGTTGMIVTGIGGKIFPGLVAAEFIIMMINYFKNSGKAKRIIMIVDFVMLAIQIILTTTVFWLAIINLIISDEAAYQDLNLFDELTINPKVILITYAVITVISLVTFIVLILITKDCRWMLGYTVLSLIFSYFIVPLLFLFLQNVIPLVTGFFTFVIIVIVSIVVLKVLLGVVGKVLSGSDGMSIESSSSKSSGTALKPVENQPYQEVKKYDINTTFWRDKGGYGYLTPSADCIYFNDAWGVKQYVCTVSDFENGKVAIIHKGSRVMKIAECKTPER